MQLPAWIEGWIGERGVHPLVRAAMAGSRRARDGGVELDPARLAALRVRLAELTDAEELAWAALSGAMLASYLRRRGAHRAARALASITAGATGALRRHHAALETRPSMISDRAKQARARFDALVGAPARSTRAPLVGAPRPAGSVPRAQLWIPARFGR